MTTSRIDPVLTSSRLLVCASPSVAAALIVREERLTGWPDEARWAALDGDLTDPSYAALYPPLAQHVACLADAVLLLAWSRQVGHIATLVRDHAAPPDDRQARYAVIVAP